MLKTISTLRIKVFIYQRHPFWRVYNNVPTLQGTFLSIHLGKYLSSCLAAQEFVADRTVYIPIENHITN